MKLPNTLTITEVNQAFRTRDEVIQPFLTGNPDMHGRRLTNIGEATDNGEAITYSANGFCTQAWERVFLQ